MNFKIVVLPEFASQFKKLAKKYKKIKSDVETLVEELTKNPESGILLHHSCYKIRVANSSIPTGKSGGFRVVYYFLDTHKNIYLISIYSKTQKENISENALIELLKLNGLG